MQRDGHVGRGVAASVLRRARAGVLQTSQTWPEIAGSKYEELAKPGERFQRLSPKAVVLPLHHSPPNYPNQFNSLWNCPEVTCEAIRAIAIRGRCAVLLAPCRPWQAHWTKAVFELC